MARKKDTEITAEPVDKLAEDARPSEPETVELKQDAPVEKKTDPRQQRTPAKARVYIGPTLPDGKLFQYTTFQAGKLPAHVGQLIEVCPALRFLFVTTDQLSSARIQLRDRSSVVAAKFGEARKHFYKGAM